MAQPQLQLWSLIPGLDVVISGVVLPIIVCFVPGSVAVLSASESSSDPAVTDSGDISGEMTVNDNVMHIAMLILKCT